MARSQRLAPPAMPRGVVLLSMLLILALLSAVAFHMVGRHGLLVAQARYSFTQDQALSYAIGAEALARQVLYQDFTQTGVDVDHLEETWARPLTPFAVEDGMMEVQVRDLNSCFNLNSLLGAGTQQNHERLRTLLRNLRLPETHADAWRDWIDADEEIHGFGAEDGDYLLLENAYRTANRPAGHLSELRLLRDMNREVYDAVKPHLCVLPTETLQINVNTADAVVLSSLDSSINPQQMQNLVQGERTFASVSEATNANPELRGATSVMSVTSEFFEVHVRAEVGESRVELASVMKRDPNNGNITLISRDFGKDFRSLFVSDEEQEQ